MKVLIIGSGGREHALYAKAKESKIFQNVYQIPKNDAFDNSYDVDVLDNQAIIDFVKSEDIDFTVVGGETTLINGIVDAFEKESLLIFGTNKAATRLESSKSFAKEVMQDEMVKTAKYREFTDYEEALSYMSKQSFPQVIKYDGLAAGKGVYIVSNQAETEVILKELLLDKAFGDDKIIVEEFLTGEELSAFYLIEENEIGAFIGIAQDYKRVFDDDQGENTGGMGAITTSKFNNYESEIEVMVKSVLKGLKKRNICYSGVLYAGLMLCEQGMHVIEFNTRLGDPETEILVNKLKSNIIDLMYFLKTSQKFRVEFYEDEYIGVVLASEGYPRKYEKNFVIEGLDKLDKYYFMNIKYDKNYLTNGGRVLFVYDNAKTLVEARKKVYSQIEKVTFSGLHYRKDIGKKQ